MFDADPVLTAGRTPSVPRALAQALLLLSAIPAMASAGNATLPDTPAGRLGGQLVRHVNGDGAAGIRKWAPTILSTEIPPADREAFIALLASSARDSGGLDVVDARSDPRQPGMLQVAVKARRNARQGLLVLTADAAHPDRLAQADLVAMDDPGLYAHWPKEAPTHGALTQLIRTTLDQLVRSNDFSGCVTVSDGAKTIFDECRGLAERRFDVPVDHQTKFHIGSMDKMFTAVAIAQLVEA